MNLKERVQQKIRFKRYEVNLMIITGILFALFLITAWPWFRNDALSGIGVL